MYFVQQVQLAPGQAAVWFLGQAGFVASDGRTTVVIDPYLSDSVGAVSPLFTRSVPSPLAPEKLKADLFLVTHDHLDHLDPETIGPYQHKASTCFVAPRFAAAKLATLGIAEDRIRKVDIGESVTLDGTTVTGVFALPTSADVLDTTGYLVTFANGRSVYHASDTAFCPLLLDAAPRGVEVLLTPINGKWGNLNIDQAIALAAAVLPRYVVPCHYDMMALNAENPEAFRYFCGERRLASTCVIPNMLQPFIWGAPDDTISA